MAYIKYKEITKYFYFSTAVDTSKLPPYVFEYVYDDEIILDSYKTSRDYATFTDKKMVLFDRPPALWGVYDKKEITTIPYKEICTASITFWPNNAEICFYLDSGYPLRLKFTNMFHKEKERLKRLYNCVMQYINSQEVTVEEINYITKEVS